MRRCGKGDKDRGLSENRFDRGPICFTQWPKGKGATQAGRSCARPPPEAGCKTKAARREPQMDAFRMLWLVDRPLLFFSATLILFIGSTAAGVVARRPWAQADIGRTGRIRSRPQCDDDAARIVDRLRHCDGGQPLRPAQEPGGIRGERDRHGIPPARPHAGRRGVAARARSCATYVDERIAFYALLDPDELAKNAADTANTMTALWAAIAPATKASPDGGHGARRRQA